MAAHPGRNRDRAHLSAIALRIFLSNKLGWAMGARGHMVKTEDGGELVSAAGGNQSMARRRSLHR